MLLLFPLKFNELKINNKTKSFFLPQKPVFSISKSIYPRFIIKNLTILSFKR